MARMRTTYPKEMRELAHAEGKDLMTIHLRSHDKHGGCAMELQGRISHEMYQRLHRYVRRIIKDMRSEQEATP